MVGQMTVWNQEMSLPMMWTEAGQKERLRVVEGGEVGLESPSVAVR